MTTAVLPMTAQRPLNPPAKALKDGTASLQVSSTSTSVSAAFARSLFLFMGLMFSRPSKLFRPSRVDTWAGLRHLAMSADQTLSASFIRTLIRSRTGAMALIVTIIPPLLINTTLGFLLFTSHSFFSLSLARIPFFHPEHSDRYRVQSTPFSDETVSEQQEAEGEKINIHNLVSGPSIIPRHPTLLSGLAGAGAGIIQGMAFTPIENTVRLLRRSASSFKPLLSLLHLSPKYQSQEIVTPVQALREFLSSDSWRRPPSWWAGWRWTVARDAASYSVFFAAFDVTRRVSLRVKAFLTGDISPAWDNFIYISLPASTDHIRSSDGVTSSNSSLLAPRDTPTPARIAQALTIVSGGVFASLGAEMVGRPFRTCQSIIQQHQAQYPRLTGQGLRQNPILGVFKEKGFKPFFQSPKAASGAMSVPATGSKLGRRLARVGWRLAAVGPWGMGFLVWAWVGGEV